MPASYNLQNSGQLFVPVGLRPGVAPAKQVVSYTLVGTSPARIDIPEIVTGALTYIQNIRLPGMLHGRVVRPRGQMRVRLWRSDRLDRRELDRAPPGCEGGAEGRLPRRRGTARVRRHPGGRAIEGQVGQPAQGAARQRQRVQGHARSRQRRQDDHEQRRPIRASAELRQRPASARLGGAHGLRNVRVAHERAHADRAAMRGRRRHPAWSEGLRRHPGCLLDEAARRRGHLPAAQPHPCHRDADGRLFRQWVSVQRRRRIGGDDVRGSSEPPSASS